jgi:molecular chaperone GrpE
MFKDKEVTTEEEATMTEETTTPEADEETKEEKKAAPLTLAEEVEQRLADIERLNDKFLRKCAEIENFKKRIEKEKIDAIAYANNGIIKDVLTVTDNLERALEHCEENNDADKDDKSLKSGVELTLKSLYETLARHGATEIKAEGCKFDPTVHEAVSHNEQDGIASDTVITVYQKGFMLKDKLLRPALVIVAK